MAVRLRPVRQDRIQTRATLRRRGGSPGAGESLPLTPALADEYCDFRTPTLPQCHRDTTEAVIGAITGILHRAQTHLLGRYDNESALRPVGRSSLVHPDTARQLPGQLIRPARATRGRACGSPGHGVRAHHWT